MNTDERREYLKKHSYKIGHDGRRYMEVDFLNKKAAYHVPHYRTHNLRRAWTDCFILDNYSIEIDPYELIAGRFSVEKILTDDEKNEYEKYKDFSDRSGMYKGLSVGSTGHRVCDYEKLLSIGVKGIIADIDNRLSSLDWSDPEAAEKEAVWQSGKMSLEGFVRFADRYREKLLELYNSETDEKRKEEYRMMAENFSHAPYEPCRHFWEAMQCMWLMQFVLHLLGDTCLSGRIDNYLYPYYIKDKKDGIITDDSAFELIEALYFKHNEIYDTWPASVMLGGMTREGKFNYNELTYMGIKAIETTALINPSVAVCYNEEMPDDLLNLCVDIISKGYTKPSIFNDRLIQEGLKNAGVSESDARYYVHSTCVEITPIAASNIQVATPYINLNKAYEYILNNKNAIFGESCRVKPDIDFDIESLDTFEKFYVLLKDVISGIIRSHLENICRDALARERYMSCPLMSALTNDCMEKGKDAVSGGARYNYTYPCFPGFMNLVDSLSAIKKAVYDEKILTLEETSDLMRNNFEDSERFRMYLSNRCPKFGNDDDYSDVLGKELFDHIRYELEKYQISVSPKVYGTGTFHPSYFAWIMHAHLGSQASATPDGRKQGEALSESLGSVQGMDKNGPSAVMRSTSKIDQKYGIGGIATNFRFSKKFIGTDEGKKAVSDFIRLFMKKGNFEIQINVIDQATLIDAQANPEKYRTLMVRVAGYSDYFVNLNPLIQAEIIKRSEHGNV